MTHLIAYILVGCSLCFAGVIVVTLIHRRRQKTTDPEQRPLHKTLRGRASAALCVISAALAIFVFVTGKNLPDIIHSPAAVQISRKVIREGSAREVLATLGESRNYAGFEDQVEQHYVGRYLRKAGWSGVISRLPQRVDNRWLVAIDEAGSDASILATTADDVSHLRPGDRVTVRGRISRITRQGRITIEDSVLTVDGP